MATISSPTGKGEVVIDHGKGRTSDLWKKEDYWAIWLGFFILAVGLLVFLSRPPAGMKDNFAKYNSIMKQEAARAPFKTIAWHEASMVKRKIRASNEGYAKTIKNFLASPDRWRGNPFDSLYRSKSAAEALNAKGTAAFDKAKGAEASAIAAAKAAEKAAADAGFKDNALNDQAKAAIGNWLKANESTGKAKAKTAYQPFNLMLTLLMAYLMFFVVFPGITANI